MSSCKVKHLLPIKKRPVMISGAQKCPEDIRTSSTDCAPPDVCTQSEIQSESVGEMEQCINGKTSIEPSSSNIIYNIHSNIDVFDSEVESEIDETVEHNDVLPRSSVDSNDDSDCVIVDYAIPTIDITEEANQQGNESQVNQELFNELNHDLSKMKKEKRAQCKNEIEKTHGVITSYCDSDSEVFTSDVSVPEQIESANRDFEFAEHPVAIEDHNNNQSLPDGWVRFRHDSGLYAYYHVESQVCTMAPPYFLGPGSARRHKMPVQAISCLDEKQRKENDDGDGADSGENLVSAKQVHKYCKNLFKFKTRRSLLHMSWKDKRWYDSMMKRYQVAKNPHTRVVNLPVKTKCGKDIMVPFNVNNKSYIMLLSEYVNLAFKKQVEYRVEPLLRHGQAFLATVFIEGSWYGSGIGSVKKLAKNQAARLLLSVILGVVPELKNLENADKLRDVGEQNVLDDINIDDPRVTEFCKLKSETLPFAMLETALAKNEDLKRLEVRHKIVNEDGGLEYVMETGQYSAKIKCHDKTDGKHKAAQEILKQIHPIVRSWGGLVRLYRESIEIEQVEELEAEKKEESKVKEGLFNELKYQFSKLEEDRREQSERGMIRSHYDVLFGPLRIKLNP